jgi:hypothetical protein
MKVAVYEGASRRCVLTAATRYRLHTRVADQFPAGAELSLDSTEAYPWEPTQPLIQWKHKNERTNKQTPWPLVRKRTIPTERPPLVGEIFQCKHAVKKCYVRMEALRFEVFTAVIMKNSVFWDVTPCGSCKNRRFGETWRLHHQGNKNR